MDWRQLQEQTAVLFRSLGCDADVDAKVRGARGEHMVDVWVRFTKFGLAARWIIECKDWSSAVPKEKVLALKSIVEDVGADRGILISSSGYQAGAIRVATSTNITLSDLDSLRESAKDDLVASVVQHMTTRIVELKYGLLALFTSERHSETWCSSRPRPGVDGNAVADAFGSLASLEFRFDQFRLGKDAPKLLRFDSSVHRNSADDFIAEARGMLTAIEGILRTQQARASAAVQGGSSPA